MKKCNKITPLNIGAIKQSGRNTKAQTARTFLTSPRVQDSSGSKSVRNEQIFVNDHPVFLYLNPAITEFETFSKVLREFSSVTYIEQTNQQLLYQFGHVQQSFNSFVVQARSYFNRQWIDNKKIRINPTGALYKTGKELVDDWTELVKLSNRSLDLGILPIFKLLYEKLSEVNDSFNITYGAVKVFSIEDSLFIEGRKNLNEKIATAKRNTLRYALKETPPSASFDEDEFTKEIVDIMNALSRFISTIPPSLSMRSAEVMRDKTKVSYKISDVIKLCDSIRVFRNESTAVKISLYHTNEVFTKLMEKLEFPFEFHIKFDSIPIPDDPKKNPKKFQSTKKYITDQMDEIANLFNQ